MHALDDAWKCSSRAKQNETASFGGGSPLFLLSLVDNARVDPGNSAVTEAVSFIQGLNPIAYYFRTSPPQNPRHYQVQHPQQYIAT
jgi:hypothetical protein